MNLLIEYDGKIAFFQDVLNLIEHDDSISIIYSDDHRVKLSIKDKKTIKIEQDDQYIRGKLKTHFNLKEE